MLFLVIHSGRHGSVMAPILIASILFLIGAVGMFINWRWLMRNRKRKLMWLPSSGKVIDFSVSGSVGSSKSYYPIISYERMGKSCSFQPSIGSNRPTYKVGQDVPILIDPENPDKACVNYFSHLYGMPAFLFLFFLVFVLASFCGLWVEFIN